MSSGGTARNRTLADLLIEKQVLSELQCAAVYERQEASGGTFEEALIMLGYLSSDELAAFINNESQVRALKLEDIEIDREAVLHVPAAVAHRHRVIPVRRSGNSLAVAMRDPSDVAALDALHRVTDFNIIPFMAREDAIEHALYLQYGEPAEQADNGALRANAGRPMTARPHLIDDRFGHQARGLPLRRRQTFETFVEDSANQFALSIARAVVAPCPEDGCNPFLCWGARGSGKSHLLNAIGCQLAAQVPAKKFLYTSGEEFAEGLFYAIRDSKLNFFRYIYRELEMLLIDDAQLLLSRAWAQRELVETFRHLEQHGGRLVLAAETNLALDSATLPELRACLDAGVIASIGEYSMAARLEFTRRIKGATDIPSDVLEYLAAGCSDDMTELMSILQQVVVTAIQGGSNVSRESVENLIHLCGITPTHAASTPPKEESASSCLQAALPMVSERDVLI